MTNSSQTRHWRVLLDSSKKSPYEAFHPLHKDFFIIRVNHNRSERRTRSKSVIFHIMSAVPSTMPAVTAALNGFSIFFVTYHTSDDQYNDTRQNRAYQNCSHLNSSL